MEDPIIIPKRDDYLNDDDEPRAIPNIIYSIRDIASIYDVSFEHALKIMEIAELKRKNEIAINDGKIRDSYFEIISNELSDINENLNAILVMMPDDDKP